MLNIKSVLTALPRRAVAPSLYKPAIRTLVSTTPPSATRAPKSTTTQAQSSSVAPQKQQDTPVVLHKKSLEDLDAESVAQMKAALGERDEGGGAGIEYEDGKAVAMKRGVRENMFRYI
ncbi:hypothetical protein K461DRAFT_293952 [Myriangium duriaei CBS 260.36]|uniref:Uncharacterized protein n=1 Tax=Myriangium duriaei CBS 260.36 TaxID=1168546 RepID=A0A9P4J2Y0_9PEZI|nr:hypothetical protein K461DRAFT_293952 [Myriangium duriaei CBS 260.36]